MRDLTNSQHNIVLNMNQCSHCDKIFTAQSTLKRHVKTHMLSLEERMKYPCSKCELKYTTKTHLKRHFQSVHTNVRFPCSQCDIVYTTQDNLNVHIRSKHEKVRYPCNQCEYQAKDKKPR